jgi:hypothetical protein
VKEKRPGLTVALSPGGRRFAPKGAFPMQDRPAPIAGKNPSEFNSGPRSWIRKWDG